MTPRVRLLFPLEAEYVIRNGLVVVHRMTADRNPMPRIRLWRKP